MKLTKRFIALLVAVGMALALTACGGSTATPEPSAASPGGETAAPAKAAAEAPAAKPETYPAEKVKIGMVTFDTSNEQFLEVQKYYDYLAQTLNIEMVYSESIDSAEGELAFIEACAAAGCKAIVGYYNIARNESVQLAIDKGMYYFGVAEEDEVYNAFKGNDKYLGGWYSERVDYDSGYTMGQALIDAGCTKLAYSSGGRDFGVKMFIDRSDGFYKAVEDAKAAGKAVEVVADISGWPGTDAFSSDQSAALNKDIDGIASSFGAGIWLQPVANSGKAGSIKIATNDALSPMYIEPFESGLVVGLTVETAEMFGMPVPMLLNALEGNLIRDEQGNAPRVPVRRLIIKTADEFKSYFEIETTGIWILNLQDVLSMIKSQNPDANFKQFCDLYISVDIDEVNARRAAQK